MRSGIDVTEGPVNSNLWEDSTLSYPRFTYTLKVEGKHEG